MRIYINQTILNRILNDDIETELRQIIEKELSKPDSEINFDEIIDYVTAIELIRKDDIA